MAQLVEALRYKPEVARSIPDGVTGVWHYGLGVDSASNINEHHEYFRCVGLITLPPSCVECHEIWEPQPPGCQGLYRDCFTFTFTIYYAATNIEVTEYLIGHFLILEFRAS